MKKSDRIQRKFIQSYKVKDYQILTDTGWQNIDSIHKTQKYRKFSIQTQTGKKLSGADNHIVFRQDLSEVFLCQLKIGDNIITDTGIQKVISVIDQNIQQNMYDITVSSKNHRFFTNGILSHNSTSYSIYVLWYAITNKDKSVLICANRLKTAMQILGRIKMAYEQLPSWLKPGIVKWNSTSVEFTNGCKISAEATSQSSGRGQTVNCISGKQTVQLLYKNIIYKVPIARAYDILSVDIIQKQNQNSDLIIQLNHDYNDQISDFQKIKLSFQTGQNIDQNLVNSYCKDFSNFSINRKMYHIIYNIKDIPKCIICGKEAQFDQQKKCYKSCCSDKCNQKYFHQLDSIETDKIQILTDTGWSDFHGLVKYINKEVISVNCNNNKIICTKDHIIYDNGKQYKAQELQHQSIKEKMDVYDILSVSKNNRFLVNDNILVHNCLLLDEFAFIAPNMEQAFMQSVFPVISSSKTSKVIIVSTPNGTGNQYYRIWNKAILKTGNLADHDWHPCRIDWYDVPGRDQAWKQQQLATFNNDQTRWQQEYGNCVTGDTIIQLYSYQLKNFILKRISQITKQDIQNCTVNTPLGYMHFEDISKKKKTTYRIYFDNGTSIGCSKDHPFIIGNSIIKRANEFKIGDKVDKNRQIVTIIKIEQTGLMDCYDLLNVQKCHCYYTNGLVSHNSFLGSSHTLISADTIKKFKQKFQKRQGLKKAYQIQLHPQYQHTKINMYVPPQKGRAYIIGGDPATGTESDYHAMTVWDITNLYNIELVADFHQNNVPPKYFAYILAKTATLYNKAYIAIQNNGVSYATIDKLCNDFQYQNVIHDSVNKKSLAISSSDDKKLDACINLKQFIEDPLRQVLIYNGQLIEQMQHFQKKSKIGKLPRYCCVSGHDDLIMCLLWAFYYLTPSNLQNFYDVKRYAKDKFGNQLPLIVSSVDNPDQNQIKHLLYQIDNTFKSTAKDYNIQMHDLQSNIQQSQQQLMKNFIESQNLSGSQRQKSPVDPDTGQQMYSFDGFMF